MPATTRRANIFIASSKEALPVARAVKSHFDSEADVDIWSENIFKANRNYLDTLLNRASFYDFVVAVFTGDDEAIIREKQVKVTRDNVIFEFGLYTSGSDRTAPFWSWRKVSSSSLIGVALKWRSLEKETTWLRLSETPAVGYEKKWRWPKDSSISVSFLPPRSR